MKLESVRVEEKCKPSFERHCALWGYKTEIDEDGFYVDSLTQRVFNAYYDAWQASRSELVVSLPDWSEYDTPRQAIEACKDSLIHAGVEHSYD